MSLQALSPNKIRKEIKLIEKKIGSLSTEIEILKRQREACYVLLDEVPNPLSDIVGANTDAVESGKRITRNRPGYHVEVAELLREATDALDINEILERLRRKDGDVKKATVYAALTRHPELFDRVPDSNRWKAKGEPTVTSN